MTWLSSRVGVLAGPIQYTEPEHSMYECTAVVASRLARS